VPNRRLTSDELDLANAILDAARQRLEEAANGDQELLFALRRKLAKELTYDERSKPMIRRALKRRMRALQNGLCPLCKEELPARYCVLDRFNAADGYVAENVRLICESCDRRVQAKRGFS
jgi:DNA repair exonuclease SbcCD ATPase subunit